MVYLVVRVGAGELFEALARLDKVVVGIEGRSRQQLEHPGRVCVIGPSNSCVGKIDGSKGAFSQSRDGLDGRSSVRQWISVTKAELWQRTGSRRSVAAKRELKCPPRHFSKAEFVETCDRIIGSMEGV